jgi:hypothetical protein
VRWWAIDLCRNGRLRSHHPERFPSPT